MDVSGGLGRASAPRSSREQHPQAEPSGTESGRTAGAHRHQRGRQGTLLDQRSRVAMTTAPQYTELRLPSPPPLPATIIQPRQHLIGNASPPSTTVPPVHDRLTQLAPGIVGLWPSRNNASDRRELQASVPRAHTSRDAGAPAAEAAQGTSSGGARCRFSNAEYRVHSPRPKCTSSTWEIHRLAGAREWRERSCASCLLGKQRRPVTNALVAHCLPWSLESWSPNIYQHCMRQFRSGAGVVRQTARRVEGATIRPIHY